jgi:dipeptidyl aminopeptidase/acylaminoacyl peptidase
MNTTRPAVRFPRLLIALALLAPAATTPLGAQNVAEMPSFRDVLSLESVGSVAISPDGSRVAYTTRTTDWDDNRYDTEIWLAGDGEPYQLTHTADGSSTSPQWTPDGRWIGFLADRGDGTQVHVISPRGGEARAITSVEGGVSSFSWSPDGSRISLIVRDPESDRDEARKDRYGAFAVEDTEYRMSHLWVAGLSEELEVSEPVRLTEGGFTLAGHSWSPDGSQIAFVRQPNPDVLSFMETDIYVVEASSGDTRGLVVGPGPDSGPVWSPDGDWILFFEFGRDLSSLFYLNRELARVPASGGESTVLTSGFDENPGGASWTDAGIRFVASIGTERQVFSLDPETGSTERLSLPMPIVGAVDFTPDGGTVAFTAQGPETLSEVYRVRDFARAEHRAQPELLTAMTEQVAGWSVGSREVVQWESEDGATIEGVLFKPADFEPGRRYPLLVQIHGGPTGTSRPTMVPGYVYPVIHWLAKGAVVLMPNYRGSAGYGEAFRSLNVRNLGVGDMWDVMSGVEHVIDQGIADPDRTGAMGWSQGGYISAFLTTNTDRFRAISVGAGISNWMTYYVNTDIHPFTRQYLKGTPWDDPDVYAKTSPMTNILEASTPTLIQHGEYDRRVPIPNAYELYQGLQDQGVETRLIVYKGFGHGINKPKELLAGVWHNWQWFGKYIWGEEIELPVEVEEGETKVTDGSANHSNP